jgi:hypothetical protein
MTREKTYFIGGLLIGILIAALFLLYFAPRYTTVKSGDTLIRQDKWTGQSWRFVDNQWKEIGGQNYDWEKIDRSLVSALRIPYGEEDTAAALKLLKEKYAILKTLSDEDLLERIKLVYSKQVLVHLYLDAFLKAEKAGPPQKQ